MGASSYRLLDAANSNTIYGFYTIAGGRSKKTAQSWRVSGGLSALPDEPAQTTNARKNQNRKQTRKRNDYEKLTSLGPFECGSPVGSGSDPGRPGEDARGLRPAG